MFAEQTYFKVLNIVVRAVGVLWLLGGLVFLVSSVVSSRNRIAYLLVSLFLLAAGTGFLLVKSVSQEGLARLRGGVREK